MFILIQSVWFPCVYAIIFVWKRKSSYCLDNLICLEMLSSGTFSDKNKNKKKKIVRTSLFIFDLAIRHMLFVSA